MRKTYMKPRVTAVEFKVENGFNGTILGMGEGGITPAANYNSDNPSDGAQTYGFRNSEGGFFE